MLSQALSWPYPPGPRVGQWDSARPHLLMVELQETTDPAVSGWAWLQLRGTGGQHRVGSVEVEAVVSADW